MLMEDVCGISYEFSNQKIPLYGYRDKQFAAVAESKELVSGLLIVNKNFKDSIAAVLLYILDNSTATEPVSGNRERERAIEDSFNINSKVNDIVDNFLNRINRIIGGGVESVTILRNIKSDMEADIVSFSNDVSAFRTRQYGTDAKTDATVQAISDNITTLLGPVDDPSIGGTLQDVVSYTSARISILEENDRGPGQINLVENKNTLNNYGVAPLQTIKDDQKTRTNEVNDMVKNIAITPPVDGGGIEKYKKSLASGEFFADLYRDGHVIDMMISFGVDDKHNKTLKECYFNTETISVHIGDRENIKEAYAFFAKTIE